MNLIAMACGPGRSAHDAIKAIHGSISQKPKWVLDADIAKCFDQIDQTALLAKLDTSPRLRRVVKGWLEAGVMDGEELFPTTVGTPQGGVISPLLANIALDGLERIISEKFPRRHGFSPPKVVRYADDFVILHEDRAVVEQCREIVKEWLKGMGLELKESKRESPIRWKRWKVKRDLNSWDSKSGNIGLGNTPLTGMVRGKQSDA